MKRSSASKYNTVRNIPILSNTALPEPVHVPLVNMIAPKHRFLEKAPGRYLQPGFFNQLLYITSG